MSKKKKDEEKEESPVKKTPEKEEKKRQPSSVYDQEVYEKIASRQPLKPAPTKKKES